MEEDDPQWRPLKGAPERSAVVNVPTLNHCRELLSFTDLVKALKEILFLCLSVRAEKKKVCKWLQTLNAKSADSLFEQKGERLTDGQREQGDEQKSCPSVEQWIDRFTEFTAHAARAAAVRQCEGNTIKISLFI